LIRNTSSLIDTHVKLIWYFCLIAALTGGCGRSPEALARRGDEAMASANWRKAQRAWSRLAEREAQPERAADAWVQAGRAAYFMEDMDAAREAFEHAVELQPEHMSALYNLGDVHIQLGNTEAAERAFESASRADPVRTEALEQLANLAVRRGDATRAAHLLGEARERQEHARVLTSLAVAGNEQDSADTTRRLLQHAVTLDPSHAPAHLNLASFLDQHGLDPAQALFHYDAVLRLDPHSVREAQIRQRIQLMQAREASGRFSRIDPVRQEVEQLLRAAEQRAADGNIPAALQHCLQAHATAARARRSDLRERSLLKATALGPESARARVALGNFYTEQGRTREAMRELSLAWELAPGWIQALEPAVSLAAELQDKPGADKMLRASAEAAAGDPALQLRIGDLFAELLNDTRSATRQYEKVIRRFPETEQAREARSRLDRIGG